jgi:hypothetical protein
MSLELKNKPDPVFGAFWFSAKIDTDQDEGTAMVRDLQVTKVRWPDSTEEGQARFTEIVNNAVPKAGFEISLERLSASLATAEREQRSLAALKNDPPAIVFSEELAVLLLYDGAPRFQSDREQLVRARAEYAVRGARDKNTKRVPEQRHALVQADDPLGPFTPTQSPPADLVKMLPPPDQDILTPNAPPKIVVATKPTELIATDGKPNWKALAGDKLLYVENTKRRGCAISTSRCTCCSRAAGIGPRRRRAPGRSCGLINSRRARRFRRLHDRRCPHVGRGNGGSRGSRAGRGDSADRRDQTQRSETGGPVRRRAQVREDRARTCPTR